MVSKMKLHQAQEKDKADVKPRSEWFFATEFKTQNWLRCPRISPQMTEIGKL